MIVTSEKAPEGKGGAFGGQYRYFKVLGLHAPLHLAVSITGDEHTGYDAIVQFLHQAEYDYPRDYSLLAATRPLHYASSSPSDVCTSLLETLNTADAHFVESLDKDVMLAGVNPFGQEALDAFADYVNGIR